METVIEVKSVDKWGEAARGGFQILPDILFRKQTELGLSPTDMLVLMNITMHWWYPTQRPFPRINTLADRMGVDARTIQRSIKKLSSLKLLQRVEEMADDGSKRVVCDLTGLVDRLAEYAKSDTHYMIRTAKAEIRADYAKEQIAGGIGEKTPWALKAKAPDVP